MTKRDLVKWLESKEREALKNAEQQYQEAMKLHNEQLYEKIELKKISDEVEGHLEAACKAYEAWEQKHGETVRIISGYSCGIGCTIKSILNRNGGVFKAMIDYDIADKMLSGKFYLSKFLISNQIKKGSSISLSGALHSRLSYPVPLWYHISDTTKQLRQEPPRPKFGFLP